MKKLLLLHGINHAMFGQRNPEHYGRHTLADIESQARVCADSLGYSLDSFQTDIEGELAQKIHQAFIGDVDGIVINAGAWTHYSYGLLDALLIFKDKGPVVEVHMSHVHTREPFRHISVIAPACVGQISGFGLFSYELGIRAAHDHLSKN